MHPAASHPIPTAAQLGTTTSGRAHVVILHAVLCTQNPRSHRQVTPSYPLLSACRLRPRVSNVPPCSTRSRRPSSSAHTPCSRSVHKKVWVRISEACQILAERNPGIRPERVVCSLRSCANHLSRKWTNTLNEHPALIRIEWSPSFT